MAYKAITATKLSLPNCVAESFFLFENPKWRGNKLVVAKGQTFRQTPVPTTSNAGATGIRMFQNNKSPIDGRNNKQHKMAAPISQTAVCTIRQIKTEREDNC